MSKVVLLAVNAKYVHSSLSVWVIAGGISKYARFSYDVHIVEATINQPCVDIVNAVVDLTPDVIGISSYIWNAGKMPDMLALLREQLPEAVIVLGGPEASNNIDYWLESGANHVLQGEGEYVFPRFIDSLSEGKAALNPSFLQAAVSKTHESAVFNEPPVDPYTDEYLEALNGKLSYIETSRGCPFKCSFCLSAGSAVKYFPLDLVKTQILTLSLSDTKTLKFVDRTFNCNADRAYELFDYVIGLDTKCRFHFEVAADLFNDRVLSLLRAAPPGRIQFEIGLQSFFKEALETSSRQMDVDKAIRSIQTLMQMQNIHVHIDLIAGLPYETLNDFMNSFDRAYELNTHHLQLGFLKLLHGSKLRQQAKSLGIEFTIEPPYEITSSPWLSCEDLVIIKQTENALQHTKNKGRFLTSLDYVLSATGERPFSLMRSLGEAVPNRGAQLEEYVVHIYDFFISLPGVEKSVLKDCLTYDWLGMVKGKNTPTLLKNEDDRRSFVADFAMKQLGRKMRREEIAVLSTGKGLFVDSNDRDPVTGLYRVNFC